MRKIEMKGSGGKIMSRPLSDFCERFKFVARGQGNRAIASSATKRINLTCIFASNLISTPVFIFIDIEKGL